MAALQERDDDASGGGNLQIYSCKALAKIGDPTALPAMREWLSYLKSNPKEFKSRMDDLIKMTGQSIRELEEKTKDQGSKKAPEAIGAKAAPQTER
jgi:hypothetical protein